MYVSIQIENSQTNCKDVLPPSQTDLARFGEIKARSSLSEYNSCKYDAQNREHKLLHNTPWSCSVWSLLDDDFDS